MQEQRSRSSRNDNDFSLRYATIAKALAGFPEETVIVVALNELGKPSFSTMTPSGAPLHFYVFELSVIIRNRLFLTSPEASNIVRAGGANHPFNHPLFEYCG